VKERREEGERKKEKNYWIREGNGQGESGIGREWRGRERTSG
jgi:hypothetical protein